MKSNALFECGSCPCPPHVPLVSWCGVAWMDE